MNCPAKTDPIVSDGHNQNPNALAADLTTNSDLGMIANARGLREHRLGELDVSHITDQTVMESKEGKSLEGGPGSGPKAEPIVETYPLALASSQESEPPKSWFKKALVIFKTYLGFIGPGMMISVAYIDPGNYATDVQAGASYRFKLLFVVFMSNIFAIVLQSMCIKVGTVTGLSTAQMIRVHWPRWLNLFWLFLSMAAIVATDVAEVIGTAIAIALLSRGKVPLLAGCALCFGDVFFILLLYRSSTASIRARRVFEFFVALLVVGVAVSFGIQLGYLHDVTAREVFLGFIPSPSLVQSLGLYLACGIVGATVMPHSLILGSGLVQDRLWEFDQKNNLLPPTNDDVTEEVAKRGLLYRPSLRAIRNCIWYSIADNTISLFSFALFVNSAILIVAGASLNTINGAANANLFGIFDLLGRTLGSPVAMMFAAALLLSGISAGIVVTMAGQVAWEGHLGRTIRPWKMRIMIRVFSVPISMAIQGTLGVAGLNTALVGSQVTLCILLPCISLPLVWFTCQSKYMTVETDSHGRRANEGGISSTPAPLQQLGVALENNERNDSIVVGSNTNDGGKLVNMRNNYLTSFFLILIWLFISVMNVTLLVLIGMGKA